MASPESDRLDALILFISRIRQNVKKLIKITAHPDAMLRPSIICAFAPRGAPVPLLEFPVEPLLVASGDEVEVLAVTVGTAL